MAASSSRRRTSSASPSAASPSTTTISARCPACPRAATCRPGRHTFLHRSWGPLEPFDNSFPELLKTAGAYSHLISDHYHYWEDGGATYHTRYNSFEFIRGQESDPWKVLLDVADRAHPGEIPPEPERSELEAEPLQLHDQPRVHQRGEGFPLGPVLRRRLRFPRHQPHGRQLVPAGRDLRSARALLRARPLQGEVPDRLRRADPRLAALRARHRAAGTRSTSCAPTISRCSPIATSCSAASSTISTRTTCGRTRR